jgi:hypothetical protein
MILLFPNLPAMIGAADVELADVIVASEPL